MTNNLQQQLTDLMWFVSLHEDAESWALVLKLGEEVGEFNEAVLKMLGYLKHKELKEDAIHEAADIVNVVFSALTVLYSELSVEELMEQFVQAFETKANKYKKILTET